MTLASLHFSQSTINSCLFQMDDFANVFSEEIDALHYKQRVYFRLFDFEKETFFFEKLMLILPACSAFYYDAVNFHCESQMRQLQNMLLKKMTLQKVLAETDFQIEQLNDDVKQKMQEFKQFLHLIYARNWKWDDAIPGDNLFHYFTILSLMGMMFDLTKHGSVLDKRQLKNVQCELDTCNHICFFIGYVNTLQLTSYRNKMVMLKERFETTERGKNVLAWGHATFLHFLMFELMMPATPTEADRLFFESLAIYEKFSHPRYFLMKKFKIAKMSKMLIREQEPDTDSGHASFLHFTAKRLVNSDPRIKHLVRAGINSVLRHGTKN
jgi:hypothetical protein